MTFTFRLTSANIILKKAILYAQQGDGPIYKRKVDLSDLIVDRIKHQRMGETRTQYEDHTFTSEDRDPMYNNNPLKLVAFHNADGSLHNYRVQHVREAGKAKQALYDAFGRRTGTVTLEKWAYHKPWAFKRFVRITL